MTKASRWSVELPKKPLYPIVLSELGCPVGQLPAGTAPSSAFTLGVSVLRCVAFLGPRERWCFVAAALQRKRKGILRGPWVGRNGRQLCRPLAGSRQVWLLKCRIDALELLFVDDRPQIHLAGYRVAHKRQCGFLARAAT